MHRKVCTGEDYLIFAPPSTDCVHSSMAQHLISTISPARNPLSLITDQQIILCHVGALSHSTSGNAA